MFAPGYEAITVTDGVSISSETDQSVVVLLRPTIITTDKVDIVAIGLFTDDLYIPWYC